MSIAIYFAVIAVSVVLTGVGYHVGVTDPSTYFINDIADCVPTFIRVVVILQAVTFFILLIVLICMLYRVRDAFAFKWELITTLVVGVPFLLVWLLARLVPSIGDFAPPYIWPVIVFFVCILTSVIIPLIHIIRTRRTLRHGDSGSFVSMESIPNGPNINTADFFLLVLDTPVLLDSLQNFMVTNWSVENLLFLLEAKQFQSLEDSPEKMQEEANRIYDFFLAPLSMFEVNLDMEDREKIMEEIQAKRTSHSTFEEARVKVFNIIKHDSLPRWRSTSGFEIAWQTYLDDDKEAV